MQTYFYHIYDLVVASRFPLCGIIPIPQTIHISPIPQVTLDYGDVPQSLPLDNPTTDTSKVQETTYFQISATQCLLKIPTVANFLISHGKDVIIELQNNRDPLTMQTILFGSVFSIILHYKKKYFVLHGSAILYKNKGVIFSGSSGAGKSTLAAAFLDKGYTVITDDVCVIKLDSKRTPYIMPSLPYLKLWSQTLNKLNKPYSTLKQIQQKFDKFELPISQENFTTNPVVLSHIYELNIHSTKNVTLTQLNIMQKFETLINNTFRYQFLESQQQLPRHLKQCAAITKMITCYKVYRPENGFLLDELVNAIEETLKPV